MSDKIDAGGQYFKSDSQFPGIFRDTFLVNPRKDWVWSFSSLSLGKNGAPFSVENSSGNCGKDVPAGSRWAWTAAGRSFAIQGGTVSIDTVWKCRFAASPEICIDTTYSARIALKDLDSLLRNPPAVGVPATQHRPSPLHISGTRATLEACPAFGRMELVDARGQILSKVTGTGRLTLDTRGHGLRWVRWTRGAEQGVQAVVF